MAKEINKRTTRGEATGLLHFTVDSHTVHNIKKKMKKRIFDTESVDYFHSLDNIILIRKVQE